MSIAATLRFIANHPVNRGQKISAIFRFAKWQIASRLLAGAAIFEWINGSKFIASRSETGITGNIYTGLHEFADMAFLLHVLRPRDTFIDIGANVGSYTVLAGAAVGSTTIAFEPIPSTFEKLLDNVHINRLQGRVEAFNIGLGEVDGHLRFTSGLNTVNHALAPGESSATDVEVPVRKLDDTLSGRPAQIIKIDVEGFETAVWKGGQATLHDPQLRAVIMELNGSGSRYGFDEEQLLATFLAAGFKTFSYDPLKRQLAGLGGKNPREGNTLFIRDEAWVRERLASAPVFQILGVRF